MAVWKAGAVFAKEVCDWFDRTDASHLLAFLQYEQTGYWPYGFIPSHVWFLHGWELSIRQLVDQYPLPPEVRAMMEEYKRILGVVAKIKFPGYEFVVEPLGENCTIRIRYNEPDVMSGVVEEQLGRPWLIPPGQSVSQLAQTCFKAVLTSLEHRAREHFTYQGKPVLQPHLDVEFLWSLMSDTVVHATPIEFEVKS